MSAINLLLEVWKDEKFWVFEVAKLVSGNNVVCIAALWWGIFAEKKKSPSVLSLI